MSPQALLADTAHCSTVESVRPFVAKRARAPLSTVPYDIRRYSINIVQYSYLPPERSPAQPVPSRAHPRFSQRPIQIVVPPHAPALLLYTPVFPRLSRPPPACPRLAFRPFFLSFRSRNTALKRPLLAATTAPPAPNCPRDVPI